MRINEHQIPLKSAKTMKGAQCHYKHDKKEITRLHQAGIHQHAPHPLQNPEEA